MRRWAVLVAALGCSSSKTVPTPPPAASGPGGATGGAAPTADLCALRCGDVVDEGALQSPAIDEASGLVASRLHSDVVYVHNDSGDEARFFAIDRSGASRGTYVLEGASARDWEDAAIGPCGDETCLFFGDIGDNSETRSGIVVYRTREPATLDAPEEQTVTAEAIALTYEDGPHDAEALLVDDDGRGWIIVKVDLGTSGVYRTDVALAPGADPTLRRVGEIAPPSGIASVTAAARVGSLGVLVRTYTNVMFFSGATVEAALAVEPCLLPAPMEMQGETIAPIGETGFITVSEGQGSVLHTVRCE